MNILNLMIMKTHPNILIKGYNISVRSKNEADLLNVLNNLGDFKFKPKQTCYC